MERYVVEHLDSGLWKVTLPDGTSFVGDIVPYLLELAKNVAVEESLKRVCAA